MKTKPLIAFTTSFSMLVAMVPFAPAMAGGMPSGGSHMGSGAGCKTGGRNYTPPNVSVYKPVNITKNIDNSKNVNVYKPVNVTKNIDNSKNVNVYKPVTVTKNIDNSKNYNITKNIDNSKNYNVTKNIDNSKNININKNINNSKYIDNSKNININKNIVINKGGGGGSAEAIAAAIAAAVAASSSSSSATNNVTVNAAASANASASIIGPNAAAAAAAAAASGGGGGYVGDVAVYQGGNIGAVAVDQVQEAEQCVYQDATVVKAIHAVCVSSDNREFPASHMLGATWLDAAYEGEVMRCIPGSRLKVTVGEVVQSDQGMASSFTDGQQLNCAEHEALRHYKDGMLKCAIAVPVPDCTERTNLRRYGTGDMFFTYRTRVCAQTHREYSQVAQQQEAVSQESSSEYSSSSEMELKGMQLDGGIGASPN